MYNTFLLFASGFGFLFEGTPVEPKLPKSRKDKQPRFGSNHYGWVYDNRQPEAELGIPV